MTFPRADILARLTEIAGAIEGVNYVSWDVISINDDQLPAIVILEGDEEANEDDPVSRPPSAPRRVMMTPHIVIAGRRFKGSPAQDIGPNLNALYAAVLKAVMTDATLASLTLDRDGVRFLGMESDLAVGRMMQGQIAVKFGFTYGLVPGNL